MLSKFVKAPFKGFQFEYKVLSGKFDKTGKKTADITKRVIPDRCVWPHCQAEGPRPTHDLG